MCPSAKVNNKVIGFGSAVVVKFQVAHGHHKDQLWPSRPFATVNYRRKNSLNDQARECAGDSWSDQVEGGIW